MTVGKDVSQLFSDVINCMQTDNLEIKKLVYLYVMNYAKNQPDMAILTVSTFVRDCHDPNPLIRALAVRTMGSIRVEKIIEHLCEPLRKCLKDEDPYVRKTAAVCVAKLYDMNQQMVDDQGFLDLLRDLLADSNGMVKKNFESKRRFVDLSGRRQHRRRVERNRREIAAFEHFRFERTDDQQTDHGDERVHRMGTNLHSRCHRQLFHEGRKRNAKHL